MNWKLFVAIMVVVAVVIVVIVSVLYSRQRRRQRKLELTAHVIGMDCDDEVGQIYAVFLR